MSEDHDQHAKHGKSGEAQAPPALALIAGVEHGNERLQRVVKREGAGCIADDFKNIGGLGQNQPDGGQHGIGHWRCDPVGAEFGE